MTLDLDDLCTEWDMLHDSAKRHEPCEGEGCDECDNTGEVEFNLGNLDDDDRERFAELKALASDLTNIANADLDDFQTLVRRGGWHIVHDNETADYAREWAQSIGAIDSTNDLTWPIDCIDWDKAWDEISDDYREVEFEGETYHFKDSE